VAKVLVVDDDDDLRSLLAAFVEIAGHEVRQASNGREAINDITQAVPDVVLLDVELPVLTGPETAYELFIRDCGLEKIPLILVSGVVGLQRIAAMVGTPYCLAKPYDPQALLSLLDRALLEQISPKPKLGVRNEPKKFSVR
jgi:CheY-like chemotaxis protein